MTVYDSNNNTYSKRRKRSVGKRNDRKRSIIITFAVVVVYVIVMLIIMKILGVESIFSRRNDPQNNNSVNINTADVYVDEERTEDDEEDDDYDDEYDESIPPELIELAKKNPEAIDFVKSYPEFSDKTPKIDIKSDVKNADGIPLFIQWDKRWGYRKYGGGFMAVTGCGPTCLSMVSCGLNKNTKWNPYRVAKLSQDEGYYVKGQGTSWEFMTLGAKKLGLYADEVVLDKAHISSLLKNNIPIICAMRPGDFTTTGHFIVLTGMDEDGVVWLNDPNSPSKSNRSWTLESLMPQIRNLWSYSLR